MRKESLPRRRDVLRRTLDPSHLPRNRKDPTLQVERVMTNNNHNKSNILNPFSPQHPAQPKYFAGRHSELDYFRSTALNSAEMPIPAPLNYAVLGTWGLGKTSLIYEYRQALADAMEPSPLVAHQRYVAIPLRQYMKAVFRLVKSLGMVVAIPAVIALPHYGMA
jgi:hypothetical protein